ncbi:MAG TPA: DUF6631 family protein [Burkholderiales bacterium]
MKISTRLAHRFERVVAWLARAPRSSDLLAWAKPEASAEAPAANDQIITIDGERIVVRELRFLESLEARAEAAPLLAELREIVKTRGEAPSTAEVAQLLQRHADAWCRMVARACDRAPEWYVGLPVRAADAVAAAFWRANGVWLMSDLIEDVAAESLMPAVRERLRKLS